MASTKPRRQPHGLHNLALLKGKSLQKKVRKNDVEQLKERILDAWRDITKEEIQNSIGCWKKRLRLIVQEDWGYY